ncbi:MAG: hypothetical protein EXR75_04455 [Myxococcales bacterium]|nr:hypothetical protein [Myxococcales bacterium]
MTFSFVGIRSLWSGAGDDAASDERTSAVPSEECRARTSPVSRGSGLTPVAARTTRRTYAREAGALSLIALGLYLLLALASYEADPLRPEVVGPNWVGPVGEVLARTLTRLVGVIAWLIPLEIMLLSQPLLADERLVLRVTRVSGDVLVVVVLAALTHIATPDATSFGAMPSSGFVGDLFGSVMRGLFSTVGSFLIGGTVVALILVERATFSFIAAMQALRARGDAFAGKTRGGVERLASAWGHARTAARELHEADRRANEPLIVTSPEQADAILAAYADDDGSGAAAMLPVIEAKGRVGAILAVEHAPTELSARVNTNRQHATQCSAVSSTEATPSGPVLVAARINQPADHAPVARSGAASVIAEAAARAERDSADAPTPIDVAAIVVALEATTPGAAATRSRKAAPSDLGLVNTKSATKPATKPSAQKPPDGPIIMDTSGAAKTERARRLPMTSGDSKYRFPTTEMLDPPIAEVGALSREQLQVTARKLESVLADYKVSGTVQEIWPGPTVTMFEVAPAAGTKVSKVAGLAADLALGLSCPVRIIAPLPGKNRIGFEMPNEKRLSVNLRQLVESREFAELNAPLPCVLGRDGIGRPVFADLAEMPHMIVAGATGQGKSVGLNVILTSLLFRKTPDELRLLMIDPKVVELAPFDRIPHLLLPVVTDMKQATNALKWAVDEMERRYQLFVGPGVRNIGGYNQWVRDVRAGKLPRPPSPRMVEAIAPDGSNMEVPAASDGSDAELPTTLPYIVIVVDEFADLMLQQGKEVEAPVARLAAKARAAGMHVILATQRPSVDVITGVIKSNFPTRIAFRVSQTVDSRTILDQQGAECLLGKGDMLVKLNGAIDLRRVQGPFISDDEVRRVTDHLRTQGEPVYDETIVRARDDEEGGADPGDAERDPMYDLAVRVVAETQKCTVSWIQRKLGIGYNRAAKIVETMEKRGVVGPGIGTKPREVLISAA